MSVAWSLMRRQQKSELKGTVKIESKVINNSKKDIKY